MLSPGKIYPGSVVRIPVAFTDENGDAVDPTTVAFRLADPCNGQATYTYGTDAEISRPSTGNYQVDIPSTVLNRAGRWRFRWETTGTGTTTALEGDFLVQVSAFFDNDCCQDYCRW